MDGETSRHDTGQRAENGALPWRFDHGGPIRTGSAAHRDMFCRLLLDTFDPYKPAVIEWPRLEGAALARLTGLPFWTIAVETELHTSRRMQAVADATRDPLIREAIALNAFEERRHKEVLENMIRFYGIEIEPDESFTPPRWVEWAYTCTGYGECFDSFFAFGLFRLAQDSGYFPSELVEVFEPIIQEEARHILFFVNWAAYRQASATLPLRPFHLARRGAALATRAWNRLKFARGSKNNSNMTIDGAEAIGIDLKPADFFSLCLSENDRRMARYDDRLIRPKAMPRLIRTALPFIRLVS